jgi:peptide/nickel transport system substrate-binding protein
MQEAHEMLQMMQRLALALLVLLTATSCGDGGGQGAGSVSELLVGIEDSPKTLDPRYATDAYGMRIAHGLIFSTLVEEGYDLRTAPGIAASWETPNETTFVFHIRPGVRFHDGAPLTSEDVKFTFDHLMDPTVNSPFGAILRNEIRSIENLDSLTVRFTLPHPVAAFLNTLVVPILPAHIIQKTGGLGDPMIGSGPFRFVSQSSTELTLEANKDYYGGAPKFDRLTFKIVSDDSTRFLKLKKGELDLLINALPLDKIDEAYKPPISKEYHIIEEPGLSYNYIAFNLEDPVLKDARVRRAIAMAVNVDEIIQHRLNGHAVRATGLLASVNPYYQPDVYVPPFDPARAKALLDEAGYPEPFGDGDPGPRLQVELKTSNNAQAVAVARILQAQLAAIGVEANIRSYEWGTFYSDIRSGAFQMTTLRWVGIIDPDFYYDVFHSAQVPPNGSNRGHYANSEMDRLLEAGRVTLDFAARKAIYSKVQKKIAEDLPYISLWHANNVSIVHNRVKGCRQHPTGSFLSFRDISLQP